MRRYCALAFPLPLALASCAPSPAVESAAADALVAGIQDSLEVPIEEGFATTPDGIRIYYRVAGTGPETVIAPFALYHRDSLDSLARGRRVVTYDPRGRGKSQTAPLDKVSLDHLLIDLETVRQAVGAERAAIIGWSGGGMETFAYALRNPQRVTRLVQLAPITARASYMPEMLSDRRRRTDGAAWNALQERIKAGAFASDPAGHCRAEAAVTVPALLADPAGANLVPDVCSSPNEHPATLGRYFGALWPSISTFDHRGDLARLTIPRLVIYPRQDNITRAGVEEWVRGQPNARIVYIEGSGHFPQFEQPEATLRAIEIFLRGDWPPEAVALP